MVRFVDVPHMRRWVTEVGIQEIVRGMADYMEQAFTRWDKFDKTPRIASHSDIGVVELMPTSDGENYAFKYVNGHPSNPEKGLQTVTAFGMLSDVASGYPLMLSEMTILTALRTATTSAFVAKLLARPDSTSMGMIGTGSQSEFQALAFRELLGINTLRIWDTDPAAMDKFEKNMRPLGFDIYRADNPLAATTGVDIITTCTADKRNAHVLTDEMVKPGMHINAIGGDCPGKTELDVAILYRSKIFIEYFDQTYVEGEIQQLEPDHEVTELWEVVTGSKTGRDSAEQITIFDSVGFAIEDFVALRYLDDAVKGTEFCTSIELLTAMDDPKNLFSEVSGIGTGNMTNIPTPQHQPQAQAQPEPKPSEHTDSRSAVGTR